MEIFDTYSFRSPGCLFELEVLLIEITVKRDIYFRGEQLLETEHYIKQVQFSINYHIFYVSN